MDLAARAQLTRFRSIMASWVILRSSSDRSGDSMKLRAPRVMLFAMLVALCLAPGMRAQTTTSGGLTGVVTDQSNAVVPNAEVEIKDISKGTTQVTRTDREGVYRFFFLAPGPYTLRVTLDRFRDEVRTVSVLLGPPGTLNISLKVAKTSTEISVSSEAPSLQTENGDVTVTMNSVQIAEVPNPGNDITYIAQTAPGVVMNTDFAGNGNGNFSVLGMPGTSNRFTMDGMDLNDNGSGTNVTGPSNMLLGQNQIQEATVVTIGYSGQFGGAAGANINFITKSGSNHFHGNAEYFWNGSVLNANNWISNAFGQPRPFDIANQWAGSFGGPIVNEKLFFFFDNEGVRILLPSVNVVQIPSPDFETATITNIENDQRFGYGSKTDLFYKEIFALYNSAPGVPGSQAGVPGGGNGCGGDFILADGGPCTRYFLYSPSQRVSETLTSGRIDWNVDNSDRAFLRIQHDGGRNHFYSDPISLGGKDRSSRPTFSIRPLRANFCSRETIFRALPSWTTLLKLLQLFRRR
jgi:carboxypeptidase family protein